jgi:hypothetical protein
MELDEDFANRVKGAGGPDASISMVRSEGFDVTPEDMRDAVLDRFGDQLTEEQLNAIAAGVDSEVVIMTTLTVFATAAVCAVYAV